MRICPFTASPVESSYDLGGLEFYGNHGSFTQQQYRSQDLGMVFISMTAFSFAMRTKKSKHRLASGISVTYKRHSGKFLVNDQLVEIIGNGELLGSILEALKESVRLLVECGTDQHDAVMRDLLHETDCLVACLPDQSRSPRI